MMLFVTDCCGAEGPLEPPEGAARRRGFLFFTTSPTITLILISFLLVAEFLMDGIALRKAKILLRHARCLPEIGALYEYTAKRLHKTQTLQHGRRGAHNGLVVATNAP